MFGLLLFTFIAVVGALICLILVSALLKLLYLAVSELIWARNQRRSAKELAQVEAKVSQPTPWSH